MSLSMRERAARRRSMTAAQRAQRRQDLRLAADLLRAQVDGELTQLQPAADRVLIWVDAALWLRRQWRRSAGRHRGGSALGGVLGATGIGALVLRRRPWLSGALAAWQIWRRWRATIAPSRSAPPAPP